MHTEQINNTHVPKLCQEIVRLLVRVVPLPTRVPKSMSERVFI